MVDSVQPGSGDERMERETAYVSFRRTLALSFFPPDWQARSLHSDGVHELGAGSMSKPLADWINEYISELIAAEPKTKFPLKCGCAAAKYISMCEHHQAMERQKHADALASGETVRKLRARVAELEAKNNDN